MCLNYELWDTKIAGTGAFGTWFGQSHEKELVWGIF